MNPDSLLVIDDNEDAITLFKFILESDTDWQIFTASNGKDGIVQARLKRPDIILLDVAMPEIDGLDTFKLLKSDTTTRSIPVIFTTAMVGVEKIVKSQFKEDVEVITKPCDILKLVKRVSQVYESCMTLSK